MKLEVNTAHYDNLPQEHLVESLGVLPYWVRESHILGVDCMKSYLNDRYGYGLYEYKGKVKEDGTYQSEFEEDEDLHFIARMRTQLGMVYFYPYAMVAIPTDDGHFVTRMD